jgi:hypothetical protein
MSVNVIYANPEEAAFAVECGETNAQDLQQACRASELQGPLLLVGPSTADVSGLDPGLMLVHGLGLWALKAAGARKIYHGAILDVFMECYCHDTSNKCLPFYWYKGFYHDLA